MSELERSGVKRARLGRGLGSLLDTHAPNVDDESIRPRTEESKSTSSVATPVISAAQAQALSQALSQTTPAPAPAIPNASAVALPTIAIVDDESRIWKMAIEKISPSSMQARKTFDSTELKQLADSIREQGVLQPVVVRKVGSSFELIAGERRWRAAQIAGLKEIPAIIRTANDKASLELGLIENIQRADLNAIEEAQAYQQLIEDYGLSHQEVSIRVGKDRSTITNATRILSLPQEIQHLIAKGELSSGHAKVLLGVSEVETQLDLAKRVIQERMAVRTLEKEVSRLMKPRPAKEVEPKDKLNHALVKAAAERLQKKLGTRVAISYDGEKGEIALSFFSKDQLNELLERFEKL